MAEHDETGRNAVLAALPREELDRLRDQLDLVDVEPRQGVYEAGSAIKEVYFPFDAVFSLVAVADGKNVVEVATIGREGMVGLPLFLGALSSPHPSFCQVAGRAARLGASEFREALAVGGTLHHVLNRLTQATMVQIAQNVVCNNSHGVFQRAARWLLTTADRVGGDEFPLTQEFLAQMLGVRRPTVSDTARRLQIDGLISYSRGQMGIVDRHRLLEVACECYGIVTAEFLALTNGE